MKSMRVRRSASRPWRPLRVSVSGRLLLADLGIEQIGVDALRFMLAFNGRGHDLVEGGLHAVELELAHELEELSSFPQTGDQLGSGHHNTWNGCVTDRDQDYDTMNTAPSTSVQAPFSRRSSTITARPN